MMQPQRRLLIIGDSITLGAADVRGREIVARVEVTYVDRLQHTFPELDICIDADVHRTCMTVRNAVSPLLVAHQPDAVLLMLGGSDADLDWRRFLVSEGRIIRNNVSLEKYPSLLHEIASACLAAGAIPILTDMNNHSFALRGPHISELVGKDISPLIEKHGGQEESDRRLDEYRLAATRVADELQIPIARFGKAMCEYEPAEVLSKDGTHPNAAGHVVIADVLTPIVARALAMQVAPRAMVSEKRA